MVIETASGVEVWVVVSVAAAVAIARMAVEAVRASAGTNKVALACGVRGAVHVRSAYDIYISSLSLNLGTYIHFW